MIIIRIEHADGNGMFRKADGRRPNVEDLGLDDLIQRHFDFPTPYQERRRSLDYDEYCAFKSIKQARQWVTRNEYKVLLANGFNVYAITVSQCEVLEYQCIFRLEHVVSKRNISFLFK